MTPEKERDELRSQVAALQDQLARSYRERDDSINKLSEKAKALRERNAELEARAGALVDAMDTCHICGAAVHVEEGPIYCQDDCASGCEHHDAPDCPSIADLHEQLRSALERKKVGARCAKQRVVSLSNDELRSQLDRALSQLAEARKALSEVRRLVTECECLQCKHPTGRDECEAVYDCMFHSILEAIDAAMERK